MLFKLALWASLTFLKDDPQIKIAIAQLVCFFQVALHAKLEPFNTAFKNTMQAFGILLAFAVSFGGLVINYLKSEQKVAHLLRNSAEAESLSGKLGVFKMFLEIVVYVSIAGYVALAIWRVFIVAHKHKDVVGAKCAKYCPCYKTDAGDNHAARDIELSATPRPASGRPDIDFESKAHNSVNPMFEKSLSQQNMRMETDL